MSLPALRRHQRRLSAKSCRDRLSQAGVHVSEAVAADLLAHFVARGHAREHAVGQFYVM